MPSTNPADPAALTPSAAPSQQLAELGYSPVQLPSRGVLYDGKLPGGHVQMRRMKSGENAKLLSAGGGANDRLEVIVNSCTKFPPGFDPKTLLLTDSMYLLLVLRTMTFGPEYQYTYRCRFCGSTERAKINIVEDLDEQVADLSLTEPVDVELIDAKCTVGCRFLRSSDNALILKHANRLKLASNDRDDPSYAYRLALMLVHRNGTAFTDILTRTDFINSLSAADAIRLEKGVDDKQPGVDTRVNLTCRACSGMTEIGLPFDGEFLRPSNL